MLLDANRRTIGECAGSADPGWFVFRLETRR